MNDMDFKIIETEKSDIERNITEKYSNLVPKILIDSISIAYKRENINVREKL